MKSDTWIYCPKCDKDFDAVMWENGECPYCHTHYYWYDGYVEELNEEFPYVEWDG